MKDATFTYISITTPKVMLHGTQLLWLRSSVSDADAASEPRENSFFSTKHKQRETRSTNSFTARLAYRSGRLLRSHIIETDRQSSWPLSTSKCCASRARYHWRRK